MTQPASLPSAFRKGLFEALLIVFSVILGLLANDWRIQQSHRNEVGIALSAIKEEIKNNYQQVEDILPYHRQIDDSLSRLSMVVMTGQRCPVKPL